MTILGMLITCVVIIQGLFCDAKLCVFREPEERPGIGQRTVGIETQKSKKTGTIYWILVPDSSKDRFLPTNFGLEQGSMGSNNNGYMHKTNIWDNYFSLTLFDWNTGKKFIYACWKCRFLNDFNFYSVPNKWSRGFDKISQYEISDSVSLIDLYHLLHFLSLMLPNRWRFLQGLGGVLVPNVPLTIVRMHKTDNIIHQEFIFMP